MARVNGVTDPRIPVHILTGFLGSGKTTLLRAWLADPALRDTAVIVNEFGEAGIDDLLVRKVTGDVYLLGSGCICCTVRDSLGTTLAELDALADSGAIARFARVAVETTGLANPAPVARTILDDPQVAPHYRVGATVATVDAQHGEATLRRRPEGARQAILADRLIVTKCDLVAQASLRGLMAALARLNPAAPVTLSRLEAPAPAALFAEPRADGFRMPVQAIEETGDAVHAVMSFTLVVERPVPWPRFLDWLELLLASRGDGILRMKGFVRTLEIDRPVLLQGVHEVLYPPETLASWPGGAPRTELVFIVENMTRKAVEKSLFAFLGWAGEGDIVAAGQAPLEIPHIED